MSRQWNDDEISVSLEEESGVPRVNHRYAASECRNFHTYSPVPGGGGVKDLYLRGSATNLLSHSPPHLKMILHRGGSRGGGSGPEFFEGGFRVQVRGNFHILTSKKKTSEGGGVLNPLTPPPGSATVTLQSRIQRCMLRSHVVLL